VTLSKSSDSRYASAPTIVFGTSLRLDLKKTESPAPGAVSVV
jgi:hypothetical protein